MYIAKKDKFKKSTQGGILNAFKQYNANNLNSFEPYNAVDKLRAKWLDPGSRRVNKYKEKILNRYRHRSFFYPEYIPYGYKDDGLYAGNKDHDGFIMNVEELATIYHFPGSDSKTPTMTRVTAKKAEPPSNLPI